jgi:hypothetical protein
LPRGAGSSLEPHGCTIVAGNYFAHGRVLARTFMEHHPDGRFTLLILDETPTLQPDDRFDVLQVSEIFEGRELARIRSMYGVMELATAVKPTFLRYLIDGGAESVLYLDPDIQIFAPLRDVVGLAVEHGIVLTPHLIEPHPRWDDLVPTEDIVMAAGIYNLGFIGVGASARDFLEWWIDCLARECIVDIEHCRFVDQRWVDLVPGYFGAQIVRDPGLNIAWWNMPTRTVTAGDGGLRVNGVALRFVHFSGYDPDRPYVLSKHQGRFPRLLLSQRPDLAPLFEAYGQLLREAAYNELSRRPYGFARLPSGAAIDANMRAMYRHALVEWERRGIGSEPPCPFIPDEEEAFLAWVRGRKVPGRNSGRYVRYARRLWRDRRELPGVVRARTRSLGRGRRGL